MAASTQLRTLALARRQLLREICDAAAHVVEHNELRRHVSSLKRTDSARRRLRRLADVAIVAIIVTGTIVTLGLCCRRRT
jgi:hypothetical protein